MCFKFHLICYYHYLFCPQIVSFFTRGSLAKLDMTFRHVPMIPWALPCFLLQQHDLGSLPAFSALILESAFHSRRPGSFLWGTVVRNQDLSTGCPSALLLEYHPHRPLRGQSWRLSVTLFTRLKPQHPTQMAPLRRCHLVVPHPMALGLIFFGKGKEKKGRGS